MKKTTLEQIAIMQAFADGKDIEYRLDNEDHPWAPLADPKWNWAAYDYQIAQEPRTIWVNETADGVLAGIFTHEATALENQLRMGVPYTRKFVEVLEG